jgi:hypothetical protein
MKKSFLNFPVSKDERVVGLSHYSMALAGSVIHWLLLGDIFVRGFILQRPFAEWGFSAALAILYSVISSLSDVRNGIYEDKKSLKGLKGIVIPVVIGALIIGIDIYRDIVSGKGTVNALSIAVISILVLIIGYSAFAYFRKSLKPKIDEEE